MKTAKQLSKEILQAIPELNHKENVKKLTKKDLNNFESRLKEIKGELVNLNRLYNDLVIRKKPEEKTLQEELNNDCVGRANWGIKRRGNVYHTALKKKISSLAKEQNSLAYRLSFHYNKKKV